MNQINPILLALLRSRLTNSVPEGFTPDDGPNGYHYPGPPPEGAPEWMGHYAPPPGSGDDHNGGLPEDLTHPGDLGDYLDIINGLTHPGGSGNNMSPRGLPVVNRMTSLDPRQALLQIRMNAGRGRPQA